MCPSGLINPDRLVGVGDGILWIAYVEGRTNSIDNGLSCVLLVVVLEYFSRYLALDDHGHRREKVANS